MFGLNKKYDIPFAIGAGALVLLAFNMGKTKEKDLKNLNHGIELTRRTHGGKKRRTKKYKNIRI